MLSRTNVVAEYSLSADLNAAQKGDRQAFNRLVAARQDELYTLT